MRALPVAAKMGLSAKRIFFADAAGGGRGSVTFGCPHRGEESPVAAVQTDRDHYGLH